MKTSLFLAAFLTIFIGIAHSVLGERFILTRLFRRDDLPKLFGSSDFTRRTLRFTWHLTTVAWWGFSAILVLLAMPPVTAESIGLVVGVTFLIHFAVALIVSRGKHFSWPIFLIIGLASIYATHS